MKRPPKYSLALADYEYEQLVRNINMPRPISPARKQFRKSLEPLERLILTIDDFFVMCGIDPTNSNTLFNEVVRAQSHRNPSDLWQSLMDATRQPSY